MWIYSRKWLKQGNGCGLVPLNGKIAKTFCISRRAMWNLFVFCQGKVNERSGKGANKERGIFPQQGNFVESLYIIIAEKQGGADRIINLSAYSIQARNIQRK